MPRSRSGRRSIAAPLAAVASFGVAGVLVWWLAVEYADGIGVLFGSSGLWWRLLIAIAVIIVAGRAAEGTDLHSASRQTVLGGGSG